MEWMEGYAGHSNYTRGYFRELDPKWAQFAVLDAGYQVPEIETAWELGFGQGITLAFNAVTQDISWFGNDFNPAHCNYANKLVKVAGLNPVFTDESFRDLANREDVPKLDFIALHGIWSWVSYENQQHILRFIDRNLSDNGIVYISYNSSPGANVFSPVRELFRYQFENNTQRGSAIHNRVQSALENVSELLSVDSVYFKGAEAARVKLESLKKQDASYLAHEYLNSDWNIESFLSISARLKEIKLSFIASADYLDSIHDIHLTAEQKAALARVDDLYEREHIKDIYWNQGFRKDIWMKGPVKLSYQEKLENLGAIQLGASSYESTKDIKLAGRAFEGNVNEALYQQIISQIQSAGSLTIGDLLEKLQDHSSQAIIESVRVLLSLNRLFFCGDHQNKERQESIRTLNEYIISQAVSSSSAHQYLCSPLTGTAISCNRLLQLHLLARSQGVTSLTGACRFIYNELARNGEYSTENGRSLDTEEKAIPVIKQKLEELCRQSAEAMKIHGISRDLIPDKT